MFGAWRGDGRVDEIFANIALALMFVHIVAMIFASFVYRENLVRAMVSGYKRL